MKKAFSLLLAVLMILMSLCACANSSDEKPDAGTTTTDPAVATPGEETTTGSSGETSDIYEVSDSLPELNYNGDKVVILSRGRDWVRDEISVDSLNGENINDAVYNRNLAVEERLGIKIENILTKGTDNYEISSMIRTQVQSGTKDYDIFANSVYATIMYTGEGLFQNLYECEYIDFDKVWWAQGFNEAASIGNAQYFATGAICLSTYRFLFATFFNRQLFAANGIELPYQITFDGKWTIDYQYEISSQIYSDANGNGIKDEGDLFGFVSNADMIGVDAYWSSCQLPILTKTADNWLEYSIDIERLTLAVSKINHLMWDNPGTLTVGHKSSDSDQDEIAKMFAEGNAAMVTLRLIHAEGSDMRNMSDDYGILPIPKLDETQEKYASYAHDTFTACGIPTTTVGDRLEEMGAVLEALAAESYRTVIPAYYETTLKDKYCKDPESIQMLDLITESFFVDAGVLYTKQIESVHQKLRTFIGSNMSNVSSTMKALNKVVPKKLEALVNGIQKIQ